MSKYIDLQAESREGSGKSEARKLRAKGRVPVNLYGYGFEEAISLHVDRLALNAALNTDAGMNAVINIVHDKDEYLALPREIQRHPVRRDVLHLDFIIFDRTATVAADIPVEVVGEVEGGVITQELTTLSIEVLPLDMPESFVINVEGREIGDVIRVEDMDLPEGVTPLVDVEHTVVSITLPEMIEEEDDEDAEGDEAVDPAEVEATAEGPTTDGEDEE